MEAQGHWESRLKASDDYQKAQPPLTRGQKIAVSLVAVIGVSGGLAGAVFTISHTK